MLNVEAGTPAHRQPAKTTRTASQAPPFGFGALHTEVPARCRLPGGPQRLTRLPVPFGGGVPVLHRSSPAVFCTAPATGTA